MGIFTLNDISLIINQCHLQATEGSIRRTRSVRQPRSASKRSALVLIKTGSDEILRKKFDGAHLHRKLKEILHAKFGKNRIVRFRSSARVDIHTDGRTDEILSPCHKGISLYKICSIFQFFMRNDDVITE